LRAVILVFLTTLLFHFPAHSDDQKPLVILVSMQKCCPEEAWPEAELAAKAEFRSLKFRVETMAGLAKDARERRLELGVFADRKKAACAVRIVRLPDGDSCNTEIWVNDRDTGKTIMRILYSPSTKDQEAARLNALRLVEALLATQLQASQYQGEPDGVDATAEMDALTRVKKKGPPPPPPFGFRLGTGFITSPGGTSTQGGVQVCLRWDALSKFSFELDTVLSILGDDIEKEGNSSTFDTAAIRAWAIWEFMQLKKLRAHLGAGTGVVMPWAKGLKSAAYLATTDRTITAYAGLTTQLAYEFNRNFGLRFDLKVGFTLPEVRVLFADQQAAKFGKPMVEGFLNLEVKIP
jgi:hypothetical protein